MDLCDACHAARALVIWWHPGCKGELRMCGHHADECAPRMLREGWQAVVDDRVPVEA